MPSYPVDMVQRIADQLCDRDWNLPQNEALEIARDIVIDVTIAVDKLRTKEAEHA